MIPLSALREAKTIITHADCADGVASALILRDALPGADVRFVQYGAELDGLEPEPGMIFCDIAPTPERAQAFVDAGAIVLDHHKTARDVVAMFGERGAFGDEKTEPRVCGAVLAYRHVWRALCGRDSEPIAEFATLSGIWDTWQRMDPRWALACSQAAVLRFVPFERLLRMSLEDTVEDWWPSYGWLGDSLLAGNAKSVRRAIAKAERFVNRNRLRVASFEGLALTSDVAESLGNDVDVVVGFGFTVDGGVPTMILSLRSHTGFDCAALAKKRGGGGHTAAAGYSIALGAVHRHPFELVKYEFADAGMAARENAR